MTVTMKELYREQLPFQQERYKKLREGFESFYHKSSQNAYIFSAPGRTEVGGNHTDHNRGHVVAAAVDLDIIGMAQKTEDGIIRLKSAEYTKLDVVDVSQLQKHETDTGSQSLIRGICSRCRELGYQVGGFDCFTMSRVLKGSGLSSSAAFEVLVVTIISHLYNDGKIDPATAAVISQYAENEYFGKPSGLLDQMACSVGGFTAMDFKDPAKPEIRQINFDFTSSGHALCVVDTGGSHADLTDEYAAIPREMRSVAHFFGKEFLREVDEKDFYEQLPLVREKVGDRAVLRAMHFFDDDRLAVKEAEALEKGEFEAFKSMVTASGRSSLERLQNVFASSAPQQQGLTLALALSQKLLQGKGVCRVHGGGFAGTIQAYVPSELLENYRKEMEKVFGENACHVLTVRPVGGVQVQE